MDVTAPWYTLTRESCSGPWRGCAVDDLACRERAVSDGYVAISTYVFCRREQVHTAPRPVGAVLLFCVLLALSVVLRRLRRRRAQARRA